MHLDLHFEVEDHQKRWAEQHFTLIPIRSSIMELSISTRNGTLQVSESLETVRRWMRLCSETHQECGNPNHTGTFPTRLLKIRATGLQLILTEVEKPTAAYATLSYCWGPPPYEFP